MIRRFLPVLVVTILLGLMAFSPALAQSTCAENLTAEDCALIQKANETMAALDSAAFNLDMRFSFILADSLFSDPVDLRMILEGAFARVDADVPPDVPDALQTIAEAIMGISSDVNILIEVPEILTDILLPESGNVFSLDLRLVDGIGYGNFDKIITTTNATGIAPGWYGVDLVDYLDQILQEPEIFGISPQDFGLVTPDDLAATGDFVQNDTTERMEDIEVNDQPMAVFENAFDFDTLLNDEATLAETEATLYEMLRQQYGMLYSNADLRQAAENYTQIIRSMTVRFTRIIGLEDNYMHTAEFFLRFAASEAPDALFEGPDPLGFEALRQFDLEMLFTLDIRSFDMASAATPPDDATLIPFDDFRPLFTPGSPT